MGMDCFYDATQVAGMEGNLEDYMDAAGLIANEDIVDVPSRTSILIDDGNPTQAHLVKGFILMTSASNTDHRAFKASQIADALQFLGLSELPPD
jgi:hypothetical protein